MDLESENISREERVSLMVHQAKQRHGLTQEKLAYALGRSQSHLSRVLNPNSDRSSEQLLHEIETFLTKNFK